MALEQDRLLSRMRDANEHLVVAVVRAQTLSDEAAAACHHKDEFLAMASHEIRTPVSAVLGWVRLLETGALSRRDTERAIAAIGRNAAALAHMIDDLLDTSRMLSGAIRLALLPIDLATVAHDAVETVRPLAAARHIQLTFDDGHGACPVRGDAERLQQVIWNLLANAIKFTPEGGRVEVFVESDHDRRQVRVVDTGQGIDPDLLPYVFDRFRQGADATTGRHTGLGLGLGIVRYLVELHGGTAQAASPGVGRGSTFTVRLPLAPASTPC